MDIRILGCYGGVIPGYRTTNFVVNKTTAIDAGSLAFGLSFEEQLLIRHVLITHSHLDHTNSLPFLIDNVFGMIEEPVHVYSIEPVIRSIREHLFNNETWPDFSMIPNEEESFLKFHIIEPYQTLTLDGIRYTPIPVRHIVPCVGYVIEDDQSAVIFTSDTGPCEEIYRVANATPNLKALITEVSFPNELQNIADISMHLTPKSFAAEISRLQPDIPILLYHLKPPYIEKIHEELRALELRCVECLDQDRVYTF